MKRFFWGMFMIPFLIMAQGSENKYILSESRMIASGGIAGYYQAENHGNNKHKSSLIEFQSGFGILVVDNFELGLEAGYGYGKEEIESYTKSEQRTYGFQAYTKKYFGKNEPLKFYGMLSFGLSFLSDNGEEDITVKSYGGGMGTLYFIGKNVGLDLSLRYRQFERDVDDGNSSYEVDGSNVFYQIGLVYVFNTRG
jgi:hypothetical protein